MIGCLPTQPLAFLAVFVYATHAMQVIAFEWKPGFIRRRPIVFGLFLSLQCLVLQGVSIIYINVKKTVVYTHVNDE